MGKRHETIERMKAITAEYLTNEKFVIENGTLDRAGIDEVNGVAVIDATVKFPNGGCSLGGLCVGQFNPHYKTINGGRFGLEALLWLMAVAGVDHSHELGGQYVRVAFNKEGQAKYIGHIVNDIWFSFEDLASGIRAEGDAGK